MSLHGKNVPESVFSCIWWKLGKAIAVIYITLYDLKIFFNLSSPNKTFLSLTSLLLPHSLGLKKGRVINQSTEYHELL